MELAAFFEFLTARWQALAGGFALLAVLAGGLGLLTRALGQKQGDRPPREKKAEPQAPDAPSEEAALPEKAPAPAAESAAEPDEKPGEESPAEPFAAAGPPRQPAPEPQDAQDPQADAGERQAGPEDGETSPRTGLPPQEP